MDMQVGRMSDLAAEMAAMRDQLAALPPCPHCFMAHHAVPYGQVYRQWDTKGRLLVWVNRGEIADIRRYAAKDSEGFAIAPNAIDSFMLAAIPVVNA